MNCPTCNSSTKVIDGRPRSEHPGYRRRRVCENPDCAKRFTTVEMVADGTDGPDAEALEAALAHLETEFRTALGKFRRGYNMSKQRYNRKPIGLPARLIHENPTT